MGRSRGGEGGVEENTKINVMKKVLFVCGGNVGRSQMAEMFLKRLHPEYEVHSAGFNVSTPGQRIGDREAAQDVIRAMKEEGIDMSDNTRTLFDISMLENFDTVVVLVKESEIPQAVKENKKIIFWDIVDPYKMGYEVSVNVRDQIKELVEDEFK